MGGSRSAVLSPGRQGSLALTNLRYVAQIEAEAFEGTLFDYVSCIHTNFAGASFAGDMASNAPIFFRAADCEGASFNFATIMGSDFSGSNFKQATTLLSPYAQTDHQADNHTRLSSLTYPADELRRRGD